MCDLLGEKAAWSAKLQTIADNHKRRYPDVTYDTAAEIERYTEFGAYAVRTYILTASRLRYALPVIGCGLPH